MAQTSSLQHQVWMRIVSVQTKCWLRLTVNGLSSGITSLLLLPVTENKAAKLNSTDNCRPERTPVAVKGCKIGVFFFFSLSYE